MVTDLTIIVPTYNERDNIAPLIESLDKTLSGIQWEVIFVDDDSPDGTSSIVRKIASVDHRVRCLQRIKRRGLSSACMEGILASSSEHLCIMDADMQHDESILIQMYSTIVEENLDLVIGSRYTGTGSTGSLPEHRRMISQLATRISQFFLRLEIKDPMSGFFMFTRGYFERVMYRLSGRGFKILLDMLVSSQGPVRLKEVPYAMRSRTRGESKLNLLVVWDFVILILHRFLGALLPYRFLSFLTVGFLGLLVHIAILWFMHELSSLDFTVSQSAATLVAMTSNYVLNNRFTFRDATKIGKTFWSGLLSFYLVCTFGAVLNVALAAELYQSQVPWLISGAFGAVAGAVWNFTISSLFVWTLSRRSRTILDNE